MKKLKLKVESEKLKLKNFVLLHNIQYCEATQNFLV